MKNDRKSFSLNVGISSVLFIFVILCLISFAVLSLSTAMSDYRFALKLSDNLTNYLSACSTAEETISKTEHNLSSLYDSNISRNGYYEKVGSECSYSFAINELQSLEITVKINYPDSSNPYFYDVTRWQIVTDSNIEYDDTLPVYNP